MTFFGPADKARMAAQLFMDLWSSVTQMSATYSVRVDGTSLRTVRESYRRGLAEGYYWRCERLAEQRKESLQHSKLDEAKAALEASKARLKRLTLEIAEKRVTQAVASTAPPAAKKPVTRSATDDEMGLESSDDEALDLIPLDDADDDVQEKMEAVQKAAQEEIDAGKRISTCQDLMLLEDRDEKILEAARAAIGKLRAGRKSKPLKNTAVDAYKAGKLDASKLSTGKEVIDVEGE
jgi:hypothetical protein